MEFQQLFQMISLVKVLLACLAVLFLFGFFIQWKFFRHRLPSMAFYMKKRFVKHNVVLGTGVILLSLAFIVDFAMDQTETGKESLAILSSVLQVLALAAIGYSYYKLVRLELPE